MMTKAAMALLLLGLLVGRATPAARAAAGPHPVSDPVVENHFPDGLTFVIEAESDAEIRDVRLKYTFVPDNRPTTAQPDFEPGTRIRATFALRSNTRQLYMPPGKSIRYSWEVRDAAGNEFKTEERETSFADTRFTWQTVTDGVVNLNFYRGAQRDAEIMAQVANETIVKAAALMGTTFDFPIKVWAYANQRDFQIALAHSSPSSDPGVLGQAHDPDTFILVVDRLSSPAALDTARHELTHLVTARALQGGPFKDLYPSWLNEGTSVLMQVSPNDVGYVDALEKAIRNDTVIPLRALTSGTRNRDVNLFYGQSYGIVKFLVDTYGTEKFAQMIREFKNNGSEDQTFQKVYGFDRDGAYQAWRTSVGLPAAGPDAAGSDTKPEASATAAKDSGAPTALLAIGGTVLLLLLAGAAAAGGLLLARRGRAGGAE